MKFATLTGRKDTPPATGLGFVFRLFLQLRHSDGAWDALLGQRKANRMNFETQRLKAVEGLRSPKPGGWAYGLCLAEVWLTIKRKEPSK